MAKRILQGVIIFFAIYSFVFVPLGKKTALEHLRAIFGTPQAREAASEVKGGVTRLVRRLESEARRSTEKTDRQLEERDDPVASEPEAPRAEEGPRPLPRTRLRALSAEAPRVEGRGAEVIRGEAQGGVVAHPSAP
jgi:hypothetical protein